MNNQLTSTRLGFAAPNKIASYFGSQPTDLLSLFSKASFTNFNLPSEMNSALMSEHTQQLTKQVESLRNPLSPAKLNLAPIGMTIEERLFDATSSVKILTAQVAMHIDKKLRDKLFSQIDSLHDLDEWDTDDKPVLVRSFASFLKMILQVKPQRHPGLGLTHEGHLIAAWTAGQDRLTMEFFPNNRVRWVLSCNDEGEIERAAGETAVSLLYSRLVPYKPIIGLLNDKK